MRDAHKKQVQPEGQGPSAEPRAAPDRRLGFLLYRLGHGIGRAFEQVLREHGIGPAHFGVLNALDAYGMMHQQQLVRLLGINRQTIVNVVNDLAALDCVQRQRPEDDKRTFLLHLTTKGSTRLAEADTASVAIEQELFENFTDDEQIILYQLLHRLATSGKFGKLFDVE